MEGYASRPIFDFISYEDVVFDTLHLILRITGKLVKLTMMECIELDKLECKKAAPTLDDLPHQKQYYAFLVEIGVKNPYTFVKNNSETGMILRMKSLSGDDCLKILKNMDFQTAFRAKLFPNFEKSHVYTQVITHKKEKSPPKLIISQINRNDTPV